MEMTTTPNMTLKLNFLVRVLRANFVWVIFFFNIYLLLEDIQDPENPNGTKRIQIDEVRSIFFSLN